MSLTQTYYLAHSARAKLSKEAARADHNLRLLVGHANLLDSLMLDLAEAEREQESWFNQTVTKASQQPKHIQFADTLSEVEEEDEDDYSWDGSDADDEEYSSSMSVPLRIAPSVSAVEVEEVDEETDDSEDDEDLALTRTSSRTPPELVHEHDSDSESDDDSPPSPQAQIEIDFSSKQVATSPVLPKTAASSITSPTTEDEEFYAEGYFLPTGQQAAVRAY